MCIQQGIALAVGVSDEGYNNVNEIYLRICQAT